MTIRWKNSRSLIDYQKSVTFMEQTVASIIEGGDELIWFLQHPSLYTAGTSAQSEDLLSKQIPVYQTGRGGQYTYHGPGQRIAYCMLDLKKHYPKPDLKRFIFDLEQVVINCLDNFGVKGERRANRIGIWITTANGEEKKIAALGIRVKQWVTYHGLAINLNPNLDYFSGIIPCGLKNYGVTSLAALGIHITMEQLDWALKKSFLDIFGK